MFLLLKTNQKKLIAYCSLHLICSHTKKKVILRDDLFHLYRHPDTYRDGNLNPERYPSPRLPGCFWEPHSMDQHNRYHDNHSHDGYNNCFYDHLGHNAHGFSNGFLHTSQKPRVNQGWCQWQLMKQLIFYILFS